MDIYPSFPLNRLINSENCVYFIEKYLKLSDNNDNDFHRIHNTLYTKPVKLIIESELYTESIHHTDLNHTLFQKYFNDPYFDVLLIRIYIHGQRRVHKETVVLTVHDNYFIY